MTRKALVVDSDFFFVEFLAALLEKRGYQVRKAYDGKQGIAAMEEGPYDIVFAELVMPKVNGRQFFEFIRLKSNGPYFPIVALSGTVSPAAPLPKNSTKAPTTFSLRKRSVTVSTRSVALTPSRRAPVRCTPTTSGVRK